VNYIVDYVAILYKVLASYFVLARGAKPREATAVVERRNGSPVIQIRPASTNVL
jgi:hypothetical protein